ncbi:MAG: hypothetical protein QNJ54_20020 [Prochloraceae cyanobacterium]|nr:hypothetical protein [Prochloraceae cyanobacterium]
MPATVLDGKNAKEYVFETNGNQDINVTVIIDSKSVSEPVTLIGIFTFAIVGVGSLSIKKNLNSNVKKNQ